MADQTRPTDTSSSAVLSQPRELLAEEIDWTTLSPALWPPARPPLDVAIDALALIANADAGTELSVALRALAIDALALLAAAYVDLGVELAAVRLTLSAALERAHANHVRRLRDASTIAELREELKRYTATTVLGVPW